ncbi:hypothetical protein CNR22_13200 [Sphingobacteriaceae bacterium]|nr:hypothetical protein CNR22_13200 [Sphingobacteriaceae bacterium]
MYIQIHNETRMNNCYPLARLIRHISLVCCFLSLSLSAQKSMLDSLRLEIQTTKQDTIRAWCLNDVGELLYAQYPDSAIIFWQKSAQFCSDKLKTATDKKIRHAFLAAQARAWVNCGTYYQASLGPDEGLKYFKKSMDVSTQIADKDGEAICLLSMGNAYLRKGDLLQALEYYHKALKIFEKIDSPSNMAYCLGNIGNLYAELDDIENALKYTNRSAKIYEKLNNQPGLAFALSGVSAIYRDNGDPECKDLPAVCDSKSKNKSLQGYLKVLDIWSKAGEPSGIANAASNIAAIYRIQGDLVKALQYATSSYTLYESLNNKQGISASANVLARIMEDKGDFKAAEKYAARSLAIAKDIGNMRTMSAVPLILKRIYERKGDYKAALEMNELSVRMRDSISNENTRKKSIKKQFEVEYQKQAEKDSILNVIKIEKAQLKHEQAIGQQRIYTFGGIFGSVLMLIVALVSFRAYKTKQKANTIISKQNAQIEISNKDLQRQHMLNQKIFSVISHDFRGPILSLNLVLNRFKDASTNEKLNGYLKDIGTSVHNANTVLNNLLNWAKTEIALESFDKTDCSIEEVVEKTEKEFAEKLDEKNIEIVRHIPAGAMIRLPHDILQIAIRNLISNAIKFSHGGGKIEIVFNADKESLVIKDFGTGMSAEKLAQLFNNQVNAAVGTNKEEGFGIGLYIVSELLYKYGFTISVESVPGEGAAFQIVAR